MEKILPNPETCILVVPVYLLNQVSKEAFSGPVLNSKRLYGIIHPLLSLEIQSYLSLTKFLLIFFLLLELVLCLSVAVPCYPKHPGPYLFEDFASTILLGSHVAVLRGPSVEVEFQVPLERLSHQFLDVFGGDRFHALIFLFDFLLDFSVVGLHLDFSSLELFHDFHLHGDCLVSPSFAPEVEG